MIGLVSHRKKYKRYNWSRIIPLFKEMTLQGMTYQEVCDELGINKAALKTRLYRYRLLY